MQVEPKRHVNGPLGNAQQFNDADAASRSDIVEVGLIDVPERVGHEKVGVLQEHVIPKLRGVFIDQLRDDSHVFRAQREKNRLYAAYSIICESEWYIMHIDQAA